MSPAVRIRLRPAVLVLLGAVALAGCSTTAGVSAPTSGSGTSVVATTGTGTCSSVSIGMRSGSVPSPHNYRWSMTLEGGRGSISAEGGDRGSETWEHEFTADADRQAALCAYAAELAALGPTDGVGGSTAQAEYTPAGGSPVVGQQGVDGSDVPERMQQVLPEGVWAVVQQQLDAWSNGK